MLTPNARWQPVVKKKITLSKDKHLLRPRFTFKIILGTCFIVNLTSEIISQFRKKVSNFILHQNRSEKQKTYMFPTPP